MFDDVTCKSCGRSIEEHRGRPLRCPDDEREAMGPHEARSAYAGPTKLDGQGRTEDGERYRRNHGLPPQTGEPEPLVLGRPFPAGPDYIYAMQESGYAPDVEE